MSSPSSEWRLKIEEMLSDGEWHVKEDVVRFGMKYVPPGNAYRFAERNRRRTHPHDRQRGDESDAIRVGQRGIIHQTLNSARKSGSFEFKEEDGVAYIRYPAARQRRLLEKAEKMEAPPAPTGDVESLLDELEAHLLFWSRAYNMMGSNQDVRLALIGDDPKARIEAILRRHGRDV